MPIRLIRQRIFKSPLLFPKPGFLLTLREREGLCCGIFAWTVRGCLDIEANISVYDIIVKRGILPGQDKRPDFKAMAELRYQIRKFLRFSENAAREAGIEPQQHQLLLAIRGLPDGLRPTIGALAERMQLQHHSTVELIDRLVDRGFLCRLRATDDRRQVLVKLTKEGENFLNKLSLHHLQELQSAGPRFVSILQTLLQPPASEPSATPEEKSRRRKDARHG